MSKQTQAQRASQRARRKQWDREVIDPAELFRNQDLETSQMFTPAKKTVTDAAVSPASAPTPTTYTAPRAPTAASAQKGHESPAESLIKRLLSIKSEPNETAGRSEQAAVYSNCILLLLQFCDEHGLRDTFDTLEEESGLSFHKYNETSLRSLLTKKDFGEAITFAKQVYAVVEEALAQSSGGSSRPAIQQLSQFALKSAKDRARSFSDLIYLLWKYYFITLINDNQIERAKDVFDSELSRHVANETDAVRKRWFAHDRAQLASVLANPDSLIAGTGDGLEAGNTHSPPPCDYSLWDWANELRYFWGRAMQARLRGAMPLNSTTTNSSSSNSLGLDVASLRYPPVPGTHGHHHAANVPFFAYAVADYFLARAPSTPLVQLVDIKKRYRRMARDISSYAVRAGMKNEGSSSPVRPSARTGELGGVQALTAVSATGERRLHSSQEPLKPPAKSGLSDVRSSVDTLRSSTGAHSDLSASAFPVTVEISPQPSPTSVQGTRPPTSSISPHRSPHRSPHSHRMSHDEGGGIEQRKRSPSVENISRLVSQANSAIEDSPGTRRKPTGSTAPPPPTTTTTTKDGQGASTTTRGKGSSSTSSSSSSSNINSQRGSQRPHTASSSIGGPRASHLTMRDKSGRSKKKPDTSTTTTTTTTGVSSSGRVSSSKSSVPTTETTSTAKPDTRPHTAPGKSRQTPSMSPSAGPKVDSTPVVAIPPPSGLASKSSAGSSDSAFFIPYAAEARIPLPESPDTVDLTFQVSFDTSRHASRCVDLIEDEDTDSVLLACGGDDKLIYVFEVQTCEQLASLKGHSKAVTGVAFHPRNHNHLLSCSLDKTIKLWNWRDGSCVTSWNDHSHVIQQISFFPPNCTGCDEKAVSCSSDHSLKIWEMNRPRTFVSTTNSNAAFTAFAIKSDGTSLIAAQEGGSLRSYKVRGMTLMKTRKLTELRNVWMTGLVFHPTDSSLLLVSADRDPVIRLVDLKKGEVFCSYTAINFMGSRGIRANFSPNGQYVYCGCERQSTGTGGMGDPIVKQDSTRLFIWQTHSTRLEKLPWCTHDTDILASSWTTLADNMGQMVVTAGSNGTINVFA